MARVNVGISPLYISDQHLIAESVEITMITGSLKKNNYEIKSSIPSVYSLGKGHINFFKNKIIYLKNRLEEVNKELNERGVKTSTKIILEEYPKAFLNDWNPSINDSLIVRERIKERLLKPLKASKTFHKYRKEIITDMVSFSNTLVYSKLNKV